MEIIIQPMNPKLLFSRYSEFIYDTSCNEYGYWFFFLESAINSHVFQDIEQIFFIIESIRDVFEDRSLLFTITS